MLHPEFRYVEPQTLPEATALLAAHGAAAVVIGGGTMLVPEMSNGKKRPRLAIGLRRLGLNTITVTGREIIIGASVNYAQLIASELIATELPLLHAMACEITGGPQIRNQGTLAGAAAYANPTSDAPACLLAHDAEICLNGPQGERRLRATDFYLGAFRTARKDDEVLTAISFPLRRSARHAFRKIKHAEGSWPILTASCLETRNGVRVALGGFGPVPIVVEGATSDRLFELLAAQVSDVWQDELADADYRRFAAPALVKRVVADTMGERS